jgi:hypothetical protein
MLATTLLFAGLCAPQNPEFAPPVRLKAGDEYVRVEAPGFAAPCWHDGDGDGKKDLVVGQFNKGKMRLYKNLGDGKLAEGRWLEAGGKTAEVPGVW